MIYQAAESDDAQEVVRYPLAVGQDTFAAIVARVHSRGVVDLMVIDPSRGPMPRWKVPFAEVARPGHWTLKH